MNTPHVRMRAEWSVARGEMGAISAALNSLLSETRAQPGCMHCAFSTEMGALVVIQYIETWSTESDLRRQVQSNRFSNLAELIEHATEDPMVEFLLPDGSRGLEYAEEVRRSESVS